MTFNEERLAIAEVQLDLAKLGFGKIVKEQSKCADDKLAETLEPYVLAIMDLQKMVNYYRKEVESEKAKAE